MIKAYLIDDERPAIDRLKRMLDATGRVDILGASTDPVEALAALPALRPDVLFLDIRMPELSGFELLAELPEQPLIVFTTAHDEYALKAFQANSIDYLLKPIESRQLERALDKAGQFVNGVRDRDLRALLARIAANVPPPAAGAWLSHLASRSGNKVRIINLEQVSHLFSQDKLTFAATPEQDAVVDQTIAELEAKLDPARFVRIHRSAIVNLDHLLELHACFGGRLLVRLKDAKKTELTVSRSRVGTLKTKLGL